MRQARWVLVSALLVAGCFGGCSLADHLGYGPSQFSAARWKAGNRHQRYAMAVDLCRSKVLVGKTHPEVVELLGEPDRDEGNELTYYVEMPFPFDWREWVYVAFDKGGRVATAELRD